MKKKAPDRIPFAKRSLGQNFLRDQSVITRIADALMLERNEPVIEIGPGRGALTTELLARGADVSAIEIDTDLLPVLRDLFQNTSGFRLIEGDALTTDFSAIAGERPVKLAANLPYYISTAILQRLAQYRSSFSVLVLMLQREVVERITAKAGESERGFLTVLIEAFFESEKLFDVPPGAFLPPPKVTSSVVRLHPKPVIAGLDEVRFRGIVGAAFRQKRKTILNNLKSEGFDAAMLELKGIDPKLRAEDLTLEQWIGLVS